MPPKKKAQPKKPVTKPAAKTKAVKVAAKKATPKDPKGKKPVVVGLPPEKKEIAKVLKVQEPKPTPTRAKTDPMAKSFKVCELIAEGATIQVACKGAGIDKSNFFRHLAKSEEGSDLRDKYIRARELRADVRFEELDDLIAEIRSLRLSPQQAKVILDAKKWQMGKENAKRYGDKVDVTSGGERIEVPPIVGITVKRKE